MPNRRLPLLPRRASTWVLVVAILASLTLVGVMPGQALATSCVPGGSDTSPPTISISAPSEGQGVAGKVTFSGTAGDNDEVVSVTIGTASKKKTANGTTNWTVTVNSDKLEDGAHTFAATATDASCNTSVDEVTLVVGDPPPPPPTSCDGVVIPAGAAIQPHLDSHGVGTVFCLQSGLYRVTEGLSAKQDQKIYGIPGETVLNGSKLLAGWVYEASNARWYHQGGTTPPGTLIGVCDDGSNACLYPDDVWRNSVRLVRVLSLSALTPGKVYVDYGANRVYVKDDPTAALMEISSAPIGFKDSAERVHLSGFTVEKFATMQSPAIRATTGWTIDGMEVRHSHWSGIQIVGTGAVVKNSHIHHNGQYGMGGSSSVNASALDNDVHDNNTAGYDGYWQAGGLKFTNATNLLVRGNHVHHNHGPGIWMDNRVLSATIDGNTVEYNDSLYGQGTGIKYEVSFNGAITNNIVRFNGLRGIYISSSGGIGSFIFQVSGNTVTQNPTDGITLHQGDRESDNITRNVHVHDNVLTMCAGTSGAIQDAGAPGDVFHAGNTFENNDYFTGGSKSTWWKWEGSDRAWSGWTGFGHDETGDDSNYTC